MPLDPARSDDPCAAPPALCVPAAGADDEGLPVRRVRLAAADWARVCFRPRLPADAPPPFDGEVFLRLARSRPWETRPGWERERAAGAIPAPLSREEAWCWLQCIGTGGLQQPCGALHAPEVPHDRSVRATAAALAMRQPLQVYDTPQVLRPFYTPGGLAAFLLDLAGLGRSGPSRRAPHDGSPWPVLGFASHVAPHLTAAERAALRGALEQALDGEAGSGTPRAWLLLALLATVGGGERLEGALAQLPDGAWESPPGNPLYRHWRSGHLDMLAGLADEARFVREARRLACLPRGPSDVRLWIAATEWRQLDAVRDAVSAARQPQQAAALARLLGLVEAPETALAMLELRCRSAAADVAARWLAEHPAHAAAGLVPAAMGGGWLAREARAQLHALNGRGLGPALAAAARHLPARQGTWLQHEILDAGPAGIRPAGMPQLPFAALQPARHPAWVRERALPPLRVQGMPLSAPDTALVLSALHDTPLGVRQGPAAELLVALRQHADPASLDAFAGALFEQWFQRGCDPAEEWAMGAIGHLGGDDCIWKLTARLGFWPGLHTPRRDIYGLMCLEAQGSPTALTALAILARSSRPCSVNEWAQGMLQRTAERQGLSCDELTDRAVPDCGLSAPGGRVLDLGRRQLRVVLGPGLTPLLAGADGRLRSRLPVGGRSGSSPRTLAVRAEWQTLKRTLHEVRTLQAGRLEEAMLNGRRWSSAAFQRAWLANPLMACLARSLVLAMYDPAGRPAQTFRVTEDLTPADCHDEELPLPRSGAIGVVHPAHLDAAELADWSQLLGDYGILPPFPQLARPVHRPDSADLAATEITRHRGAPVRDALLHGLLAPGRFVHECVPDRPDVRHWWHFPGAGVTACIRCTGPQVGSVYFTAGPAADALPADDSRARLRIGAVDPAVLSEVLRLLHGAVPGV